MNRRQKIIVSVTGIFLVLLLLVGLTYAYFLTRVTGNTNDKSISVSTANLKLVYGDGNGIITGDKILPGTTLDTKTFTVTNEGNKTTSYVVIIEDAVIKNTSDNTTTTFESNDFVYTLTCTNCDNQIENETTLPLTRSILVSNIIEVGVTQEYTLIVTYKETGVDQSNDMGKSLTTKVNIANDVNIYSNNKDSLAYNIVNNALMNSNGTIYREEPYSKVGTTMYNLDTARNVNISELGIDHEYLYYDTESDASKYFLNDYWYYYSGGSVYTESGKQTYSETCNDSLIGKYIKDHPFPNSIYDNRGTIFKVVDCDGTLPVISTKITYESPLLSTTDDDYGISFYYKGNVKDNYVRYSDRIWKISRIRGDGSVLMYDDLSLETAAYEYASLSNEESYNLILSKILQSSIDTSRLIYSDKWCMKYDDTLGFKCDNDSDFYSYNAKNPFSSFSTMYNEGGYSYATALTEKEMKYNSFEESETRDIENIKSFDNINFSGSYSYNTSIRLAVALRPGTEISGGNGTSSNPYTIK